MPRIQMTPLVRWSLYFLRLYLVFLLVLILLRFLRVHRAHTHAAAPDIPAATTTGTR